jgi:L-ascorbate metabolism protein UlaG (beta-lactamase superfamily)
MSSSVVTVVSGPTALIESGGFRLLTDPTFDAPGDYKLGYVTLTKVTGPALSAEQVGAVLVSHDQHSDNFDQRGVPTPIDPR